MKPFRFLVILTIFFAILYHSSIAQQDLKSAYIKNCLKQIFALIEKEYVDPVSGETVLTGALREMKKVDSSIPAVSCREWGGFEKIFDRSYGQNPQLASPLGEAAIRGMVKSLGDPYSLFLNASEWDYYERAIKWRFHRVLEVWKGMQKTALQCEFLFVRSCIFK